MSHVSRAFNNSQLFSQSEITGNLINDIFFHFNGILFGTAVLLISN